MKLVGYYQACERLDETALAPVGERVATKIKEQFGDAVALVVCHIFHFDFTKLSAMLQLDGRDLGERLKDGEASLIVSTLCSSKYHHLLRCHA